MDAQVENAIEIAFNPTSDQSLKAQAYDFLNQLRSDPSGWQVCLALFTRTPRPSEVVRHVALEIINNAVQTQQLDSATLSYVKDSVIEYVRRVYNGSTHGSEVDTASIQNKLVQTITYLFTVLYTSSWEAFFEDFISLANGPDTGLWTNAVGIIFYLRIANSIHDEIADQLVPRSLEEQKRNNDLKDLIRARDVKKVVTSWREILTQWRQKNDSVIELCLKSVGRWVNWIDISLVVNADFLNILFQLIGEAPGEVGESSAAQIRIATIETFCEIVGKKMKPPDKIDMILFLNLGDVIGQLIASPPLHDFRSTSSYDTDLAEAVAKLANSTSFDIIKVLDTELVDDGTRRKADELLQTFIPQILRFFSDEYDEICSTVILSLSDLLTFFRKEVKSQGRLPAHHSTTLPPILNAIILKMKYDETSSWGDEDEKTDEAEFQELRKRLQILQQNVAAVDEHLYIEVVSDLVGRTFQTFQERGGQMDWRDVDLALHEMYLFGELAVKSGGLFIKNKPSSNAAERLLAMMQQMVDSDIANFSHPAIHLQYMEISVRYCAFFEHNPGAIPRALEKFVRFIHHDHIKVKTRSWYLFHRFVKHLRAQLGDVAQTVIEAVADLLIIRAELPQEGGDEDDMSSDENDQSADAIFNSQLFLFEAIGNISSTASVPVPTQVLYADTILKPLLNDIQNHMSQAQGGDERATLQIHHNIMALGTLARGYSEWMPGGAAVFGPPPPPEISDEFSRASEPVLISLEALKTSLSIRTAARFAFSRLIGVLGSRILPQLPRWIDGLLSQSSSKDEMATFLRVLEQVVFGFKAEIFDILDSLLTPLIQRIIAGLSEPTSGTDDEIQLAELRREYLNFLLIILNNDLGAVLISSTNQQSFETVISSLELFTKDSTDYPSAKLAFNVLIRMCTVWGGPDVVVASNVNSISQGPQPTLEGFDQFMMQRFSPLSWSLPTNAAMSSKDPQARQVLAEIATFQKTIYSKTGEKYLEHLRSFELLGVGLNGQVLEEYIAALSSLDLKEYRQFFQLFIQRNTGR